MKKIDKKLKLHSLLLSGMLGFLLFPGLANSFEVHAQAAPGQHTHFDTERVKPGVVFSRSYRTQTEIDMDWFTYNKVIPVGHEDAGYYDPSLDGAIMPIRYNKSIGQLRRNNEFSAIGGNVWAEFEIYIPQAFYDFDFVSWDSMKIFRVWNNKENCSDKNEHFMTPTWVGSDDDTIWFRGRCGMADYKTGYQVPGDRWTRILMNMDMVEKLFEVWATDVETNTKEKIFSIAAPGMAATQVIQAMPLLHSTSRTHNGPDGPPHPDFFIGYRNVIVRSDTDSPAPDSTAPSPPSGFNVQ